VPDNDDEFPHEKGDLVLVRVREQGNLLAKFCASIDGVEDRSWGSTFVWLALPFASRVDRVKLKDHEAEFEAIDSFEEVNF
jgi:hypothetical protein